MHCRYFVVFLTGARTGLSTVWAFTQLNLGALLQRTLAALGLLLFNHVGSHPLKRSRHIDVFFARGFKKLETELLSKGFTLLI
jgi:hypothetical protein